MAVAAMKGKSKGKRGTKKEVVPLNGLGLLLLPFILWGKTGAEREHWERRRDLTVQLHQRAQEKTRIRKELHKEAMLYAVILREQWVRLGGYFAARWRDQDVDGRKRRRQRIEKVKFRQIVCTPEAHYFELQINERGLFRYKSAIPHKVRVADLIHPDTLKELGDACKRPVTARRSEGGVWVIVHRNGYVSALPELVKHHEVLQHLPADAGEVGALILGIGEHRQVHMVDLDHYPHILIAGASGGGKSNMLNHILCTLIRFAPSHELRIRLIDPKRLELTFYRTVPHLDGGILYNVDEAVDTLDEMIEEVMRRTTLLEGRARKLSDFNARYPEDKLPRIVIEVEEMAALMRSPKEGDAVKEKLTTLANLGRAVGVHLILCTQLPIVQVIPSTIKVSMWVRIAGRVQNSTESVTILGSGDAAALPGIAGRMLYGKDSFKHQIQTPLCTDEDVQIAIGIAKGRTLGWVELDGAEPVIARDYLLRSLCWNPIFRRRLSPHQIYETMKGYGISKRQVRAFVEDVVRAREITVEGAVFQVVQYDRIWVLEPMNEAAQAEPHSPDEIRDDMPANVHFDQHWQPRWARRALPAPAPLLMLPAPRGSEPEISTVEIPPAPAPQPRVVQPTIPLDETAQFELFLDECVTIDWKVTSLFKDIYARYEVWCTQKDVRPITKTRVGSQLGKAQFRKVRLGTAGERAWQGVKLVDIPIPTTPNDIELNRQDTPFEPESEEAEPA